MSGHPKPLSAVVGQGGDTALSPPSIGGSIPIVFSYFSEFLAQEKRGEHLSWLCMFWMIGGIYASAMAWAIIPHYGKDAPVLGVSRFGGPSSTPPRPALRRVEFPDGLRVPVPQLAGVRAGLRLPLRVRHRGAQHHAREPPLLPGGGGIWGDVGTCPGRGVRKDPPQVGGGWGGGGQGA